MAYATIQTSFSGGEISPSLYARVDLDKYEIGAALIRNFYVDFRGGAVNRPGTRFIYDLTTLIGEDADYSPFLQEFIVSTDASYVLVFADLKIFIFLRGIYLSGSDVTTPYLGADLFDLKFSQSADVLTITHPSYPPANLTRTDDITFFYAVIVPGAQVEPPALASMTAPTSGDYSYGYVVTAVSLDGREESRISDIGVKHSVIQDDTVNRVIGLTWTAPAQPVSRYNIYKWGPQDTSDFPPASAWGYIGSSQTTSFVDINIAPNFGQQPPRAGDPFSGGQITSISVTNGGSGYVGTNDFPNLPYVPLTITGDGSGAFGWALIDPVAGEIISAFITYPGQDYTTATITANGESGTGATFTATFSNILPLNPSCVSYLQQRRVFAGSNLFPQTFVCSQPGAYDNFDTTPVGLATDSITATVASQEVNTIRSLVPVSYGLLAFTSGGCFLINGGSPTAAITPETISVTQQASPGANKLQPLLVNYDVIFGQTKGNRLRNASFAWERQSYTVGDITQLAPHLFDTYTTVDWAWAEEPFKLIYAVRDDGRLLTCTYVPEQQVYAWARHDTQGLFTSVAAVPEDQINAVYVVVQRHIPTTDDTSCWKYYLERFPRRQGCCIYNARFLDSHVELNREVQEVPIWLTAGEVENTVNIFSYDPCTAPENPPVFSSSYGLFAEDNIDTANAFAIDANSPPPYELYSTKVAPGMGYNPVTRKIYFATSRIGTSGGNATNDTGQVLWDGDSTIGIGDAYSEYDYRSYRMSTIDIDTKVVTFYDPYDPANLVPAGIGGGDGTWGRFVNASSGPNLGPTFVDPLTGSVFWHNSGLGALACSLYFLPAPDFKQNISPYANAALHLNLIALGSDWLVLQTGTAALNPLSIELIPRTVQTEEITADAKLSFANFSYPTDIETQYFRTAIASDDTVWYFGAQKSGAKDYQLFKLEMPTSAPYGGPTVGGGFTDVTPWTTDGPNTNCADWTNNGTRLLTNGILRNVLIYLPATHQLAAISGLLANDNADPTPDLNKTRYDCTYYDIDADTFDYHEGFLNGWMKADWTPGTDDTDSAWAVMYISECSTYRQQYSYTFDEDYTKKWFFVTVQAVPEGGPFVYDVNNNHIMLVEYQFVYGSAPVMTRIYDETLWLATYGYVGANPVEDLMTRNTIGGSSLYPDAGVWDEETESWWWAGKEATMPVLDPAYEDRTTYQGGGLVTMPFLRVSLGGPNSISVDDVIHIDCGKIQVTQIISPSKMVGEIINPIDLYLPDDPDHTLIPVEAGDWTVTTPSDVITGLDHLEAKEVYALADGQVVGPLIVEDGQVTLPEEASSVVVGLRYTQQIKTLYLTAEGINQGTEQGKRKLLPATTLRLDCTRGIECGPSFDDLTTVQDTILASGDLSVLFTGDAYQIMPPDWNTRGEVCVQQVNPLPATILGVIPNVVPGDTGR